MPIPRKTINIDLQKNEPTVLTPELLKTQLNDVGLNCPDTSIPRLTRFIDEVNAQIPNGLTETYAILQPASPGSPPLEGFALGWQKAADGNWQVMDFGYDATLEYIQYPAHFDWLKANRPSFTGNTQTTHFQERYQSVDSIKDFFANVTTTASAAVLNGINKSALNAVMSNAISPLNDASAKDYDKTDSRVLFLVDNYDPVSKQADAIGVMAIEWHLVIKDYQQKKQALQHDTTLDVTVRVVLYDDLNNLQADYNAALAHFGNQSFLLAAIPPVDATVKIYDQAPPASADTFQHSLPVVQVADYLDVLVMYAPDLQVVGSVDNSNSSVATSYTKSITTGFTFSSTQTIGFKAGFEAGVVFAKASFEITFAISFTEQYSKTTTEAVSFAVPSGQKAFLYQGLLQTRILRYDPAHNTYTYMDSASFLTNIFDTFQNPIPAHTVTILRQLHEEPAFKEANQ
jgi:hypothetical protein